MLFRRLSAIVLRGASRVRLAEVDWEGWYSEGVLCRKSGENLMNLVRCADGDGDDR
jgi:hypothetical protein